MHIAAATELVAENEEIHINVTAANNNALIGRKGMVLDAAQTLAGAVANIGREDYKRVVVDCENYRENREETLERLAHNLAAKAVRLGRKVRLEPMNPYERRIIHAALSQNSEVTTESEGKEPARYIVIIPAGAEDDLPPLYAGNDKREAERFNRAKKAALIKAIATGGKGGRENRGGRGGYGNRNNRGGKGGFNRGGRPSGDRSSIYKKPAGDFSARFSVTAATTKTTIIKKIKIFKEYKKRGAEFQKLRRFMPIFQVTARRYRSFFTARRPAHADFNIPRACFNFAFSARRSRHIHFARGSIRHERFSA